MRTNAASPTPSRRGSAFVCLRDEIPDAVRESRHGRCPGSAVARATSHDVIHRRPEQRPRKLHWVGPGKNEAFPSKNEAFDEIGST